MYSARQPADRSTPDSQRLSDKELQRQRVERLVALGLLDDPGPSQREKKGRNGGSKDSKQNSSRVSQDTRSERHGSRASSRPLSTADSVQVQQRSHHTRHSSLAELKERRNSMVATKPRETRRDRTFVGTQCATCEEPLEHTLRGEKILSLSCGHVSHEACFYEYIKEFDAQTCPSCNAPLRLDGSRGGAIDFQNFNRVVRAAHTPDLLQNQFRDVQPTPTSWDTEPTRPQVSPEMNRQPQKAARQNPRFEHSQSNGSLNYQFDKQNGNHGRNYSRETEMASNVDSPEVKHANGNRRDYDMQSIDTSLSNSRLSAKNPIPAPTITLRSEIPTLTKSRHRQSLTCLVTVESVNGKWQANPDDFRSAPPVPATIPEESYETLAPQKKAQTQQSKQGMDSAHDSVHEEMAGLEEAKEELYRRCENWHGLDFARFGRLILHDSVRVGKDRQAWQELECFLFTEMLICVKPKKNVSQQLDNSDALGNKPKVSLKGSILVKKHLKHVETVAECSILTLTLSVAELPQFHLQFSERSQLETWRRALLNISSFELPEPVAAELEPETGTDEEEYATQVSKADKRSSSMHSSSYGASRSQNTLPTEYTNSRNGRYDMRFSASSNHVPLDIVVVIPVSSSMQGLKVNLLRDSLRFLVSNLGERDRMGLVSFGSGSGGAALVGMNNKNWAGWSKALDSIRPVGYKNMRADVVEGANVAMDLLMQRKTANPISSILLISDSPTADHENVDFIVSRAEAAKVGIHSFGLGLTHKPDAMVELSTRTKASYTYAKDWMMLRECLAGCVGSLQSTSHSNVKLKLRLPEGSPAKFAKISGALQITKRAAGRDAEIALGDLRFGDKRDVLVQLAIAPDATSPDSVPSDPWQSIISGLEALGGPLESDESGMESVDEVPLIQADLTWGDILRDCNMAQLPRPSLLAITMLPPPSKKSQPNRPATPPIPPHPLIVQRRMELLTSDMLSRSLTLVSRGRPDRASHILAETRSILKGLGKGGLPPLPFPTSALPATPATPKVGDGKFPKETRLIPSELSSPSRVEPFSPFTPVASIDVNTVSALDSELESSLEWISHPAVFSRDTRKAVLQAIGVINSQRAYTFRTAAESLWASRIAGIKLLAERNREWREAGDESLMEE